MSKYQILRTAKADEQISDIIHYVAADSGDPMVALACLDRMEQEIRRLEDFPFIGSVPRYAVLRHRGYRYLISDRWLVFYKVNEKERLVIVYAVLDARQDYLNLVI